MTHQLRLVEPIEPIEPTGPGEPGGSTDSPGRRRKRASRGSAGPAVRNARAASPRGRRTVSWGEWQLDSRTRVVGKAGIAAARRALEDSAARAHAVENHRQAS